MGYKTNIENWEGLAQKDALWSILTDPQKQKKRWNEDEFFQTGKDEVDTIFQYLEEKGIAYEQVRSLDFGCGVGRLSRALLHYFKMVDGADASLHMIEKALDLNRRYSTRLAFIHSHDEKLSAIPNDTYDLIFSTIVIQHIPPPEAKQIIAAFSKKLKMGGLLVFQLPVEDLRNLSPIQKIKSKIKIRERLALMGIGTGFQMEMHTIPESELAEIFERENLKLLDAPYTNHTQKDYNGKIRFISREDSNEFVSKLYILRKA